jgi:hypothetical protein
MKILAIADTRNRWWKRRNMFKKDGDEFKRQAQAFRDHWEAKGATVTLIETSEKKNWKKHRLVLRAIEEHEGPIDVLALFCHGWHNGISLGFTRYLVPDLGEALIGKGHHSIKVVLYACSTFRRLSSFGPRLCEWFRMHPVNVLVVGHSTKGHATRNPFVYNAKNIPWVLVWPHIRHAELPWGVRRKHPEWKAWVKRLKGPDQYDFWA